MITLMGSVVSQYEDQNSNFRLRLQLERVKQNAPGKSAEGAR